LMPIDASSGIFVTFRQASIIVLAREVRLKPANFQRAGGSDRRS
jgi:hypothetical protein